ncbi:hypothetical protein B0O99DRAFT_528831 [Bisporella sp. PMI_857]|nr:hypothetical protein B0O99DRAFT_528831 [Bisporella sp. PMI_857]
MSSFSHTSHKLQPCNVAPFAPLKAAYRDQVDRLEQKSANTIGKKHFTSLYTKKIAFTPKNIKAGFAASGLFPFNPDRVLRSMPAPPVEPAILSADKVKVKSCRQNVEPQTPVTPVSAESFMLLQNLIIQRDAHALNEMSKQNLAKHLQKCTKAFQKSSAQAILQENRIQFLTTTNNEAKVRRSTKLLVLGKAKVMSYKDLQEARAKRAEKDAAKEAKGKGNRGRKRKSATSEAEEATADKVKRGRKSKSTILEPEPEPEPEEPELEPNATMARMSKAPALSRALVMEARIVEDEIVPEPWRAPVAKMW